MAMNIVIGTNPRNNDKTYVYSGTQIADAVASDLWQYYCSIKYGI